MSTMRRYGGFSLVEVLLAVGTLAIGMIFIAGTFLVAIHFSGVSAERTTAVIVANEAFAKIRIFGVDLPDPNLADDHLWPFEDLQPLFVPKPVDDNEFAYPSTWTLADKQYFWSALCRGNPDDPNRTLQVTVFVSRKVGAGALYPLDALGSVIDRPVARPVDVSRVLPPLSVDPCTPVLAIDPAKAGWVGAGYTIVEGSTGRIYRVIDQDYDVGDGPRIHLDPDKPWPWPVGNARLVWVVPPPIGRGKGPCIEVYQGEVRF